MALGLSPPATAVESPSKSPVISKTAQSPTRDSYFVEDIPIEALEQRVVAWDDLARQAIEPNPFQESWVMLPALKHFRENARLRCLLVYWYTGKPQDPREPLLCGIFIFSQQRSYQRLPLRTWSLWQHDYSCLSTPLIRQRHAREVLNCLLAWLQRQADGPALLDFSAVHGEGAFQQAFVDVSREHALHTFPIDVYNRAFLIPAVDADTYIACAMTAHNRQELRRQRRRLTEQGRLELRELTNDNELESWIESFLQLEGCGWKGAEKTALREQPAHADFFRTIARSAFERHRLMLFGLFLDDRPIAVKCNFRAGAGAFAFKIGFDESLARFSPGVQLELENIQLVHQTPGLAWMDSCATPRHFMINRLWSERRTIQKLLISTGRCSGDLLIGLLPLIRGLKRCWQRRRNQTKVSSIKD